MDRLEEIKLRQRVRDLGNPRYGDGYGLYSGKINTYRKYLPLEKFELIQAALATIGINAIPVAGIFPDVFGNPESWGEANYQYLVYFQANKNNWLSFEYYEESSRGNNVSVTYQTGAYVVTGYELAYIAHNAVSKFSEIDLRLLLNV